MSDKKPGFFKRLLGNLIGSTEKQEAAPEPEVTAAPPPKADKKKAPSKAKKPAARKPPSKKPPAKAKQEKPPARPKTAKKPATKAEAGSAAKKQPSAKPAAKKPAAKKPPAKKKADAPEPQPSHAEAPPKEKKRRSLGDILSFRDKQEKPPEQETASEPEAAAPVPESVPQPEPETPKASAPAPEPEAPAKKGWFSRLRDGLSKTSNALTENITTIFTKRKLDSETLQELEDALIQADLGVDMAVQITEEVARGRYNKEISPEEVRAVLGAEVAGVLDPMAQPLTVDPSRKPHVMLVVGVNGTGKTTTIGKLAHRFAQDGNKVVLAAGDTFRAAAIDQLEIWGERTGAPVVARDVGADAAGLAYDALEQAREQGADVLLIDTAGRLQNKKDLMDELAKIVRVVKKLDESAPHSVLLVLDATTGQNAIRQVEVFQEIAGVTGLIMTKLDGTARGGILVAIAKRFALPVHAIGVGETIDDLQPFDAYEFAAAIAGASEMVEA